MLPLIIVKQRLLPVNRYKSFCVKSRSIVKYQDIPCKRWTIISKPTSGYLTKIQCMAQTKVKLGNEWMGWDTCLLEVNVYTGDISRSVIYQRCFWQFCSICREQISSSRLRVQLWNWIVSLVFQNTRCPTQMDLMTGSQTKTCFKL